MAFYEQKAGLCLEFSMTSSWSRAPRSQDSRDGVGLHQTGRLDWVVTLEEEERERETKRPADRDDRITHECPEVCANFFAAQRYVEVI